MNDIKKIITDSLKEKVSKEDLEICLDHIDLMLISISLDLKENQDNYYQNLNAVNSSPEVFIYIVEQNTFLKHFFSLHKSEYEQIKTRLL